MNSNDKDFKIIKYAGDYTTFVILDLRAGLNMLQKFLLYLCTSCTCILLAISGKNPVLCGEVSTIEIQRDQADLGMSVVGGCDTPLVCYILIFIFKSVMVSFAE
jgi:hypothetical protein